MLYVKHKRFNGYFWEKPRTTSCYTIFLHFIPVSVTVKWLAVKTASEMIYTVSGGALNSAQSNPSHFIPNFYNLFWGANPIQWHDPIKFSSHIHSP